MSHPLVSVIITTYNREKYLETAIESVVNQTYGNIEIVVVDDGSNFNYAASICDKFENCTYHHKPNGGISSARNYGIQAAKGEFIAFLDDDDCWAPTKLEIQVPILENNPTIDLIHSKVAIMDALGQLTGEFGGASSDKLHKRSGYVFWNALGCWLVKSPTPLIRKKVFRPDMFFDESIATREDVDFYQRLFYRHKVIYIDEPLAYYREYDNQDRLSLQKEKYIGVEKKMYQNFKTMGIKNPFHLYFIALKLAKSNIRTHNNVHTKRPLKVNRIKLLLNPFRYLKELI
jgi:glycosyltransferase involved in cell wall biosynthesis